MSNDSKVTQKQPSDDTKSGTPSVAHENGEASWGDRWKHSAFKISTYTGINYFVNTLLSVAIAYQVDRKYDVHLQNFSNAAGKKIASLTGFCATKEAKNFHGGIKGITLTMGGTMLVPVIKTLEDHRHAIEFNIGHGLDVLQDKLGRSNEATRENLTEYNTIKKAIKTHKPVEGLSDTALGLIGKQHGLNVDCENKLSFNEQKLSWTHAIVARAVAWGAVFATNNTLYRVGLKQALDATKGKVTAGIASVMPTYNKLGDPDLFSKNLVNDAILTVSSAVTQPFIQKLLSNKKNRSARAKSESQDCIPATPKQEDEQKWTPDTEGSVAGTIVKPVEGYQASVAAKRGAANDPAFLQRA